MSRREFTKPTCSVEGCAKPTVGRGWCRTHYNRWRSHGSPTGGGTPKGALEQWIKMNAGHQGDACLDWPFHKAKGGVAGCTFRGKHMNAARAMCIEAHGEPPTPAHDAAHSCGKAHEGCVNPRHLRWATKTENQADRLVHGTALFGEQNPAAKLSDEDIAIIVGLSGSETHKAIASRFNISRQHVGNVLSGKRRTER